MKSMNLVATMSATAVVTALLLVACTSPQPPAPASAAPQPDLAPRQGSGTVAHGIGVSGQWNIEVRNPDGTVAHTRAFHNEFMDAQNLIVQLLTSQRSAGHWSLRLVGDADICGTSTNCHIFTLESPLEATVNRAKTPLVTPGEKSISLSGSIIATAAGGVLWVDTDLSHCLPSLAPEECPAGSTSSSVITRHAFEALIPVLAGQQIMVSVELRFGPAAL